MTGAEIRARCAMAELPDAPDDARAPEWVELLPGGRIIGRDGRTFVLDDPQGVVRASIKPGAELPIDYEHQSDDPDRRTGGPSPAAGWITELEIRDGAIWGRVNWTDKAANMIGAREYRYLSPVLGRRPAGRVTRLLGAGLVHRPNLELQALASQEEPMADTYRAAVPAPVAEALALNPDTATAEDIVAAINALATPDPAKYMPMQAVKELLYEHSQTKAALGQDRAEAKVREAMDAGYITPGMRDWAMSLCAQDPESFDAFLASALPAYAHLDRKLAVNGRGLADMPAARHSPEALEIARNLGIDPDKLAP